MDAVIVRPPTFLVSDSPVAYKTAVFPASKFGPSFSDLPLIPLHTAVTWMQSSKPRTVTLPTPPQS